MPQSEPIASKPARVSPLAAAAASLILKLQRRDDISPEEEAAIHGMLGGIISVDQGQDIVAQGSRPTSSTLLVDGFAARYVLLKDGRRQITAVHVPGDFVDLHSFLLKTMDHGIVALSACRVAPAPHATLAEISREHPHLTRMFWLNTLIDGAIHREWLAGMGRRRSVSHMAHLICEIYTMLEILNLAPDFTFFFPITQRDLADMLGLSEVHTNRVLQELRDTNMVQWHGGIIRIFDWPGLQTLAEFDPTYLQMFREPR